MLKKLRLKFILINMTIVTIMLGVIFGLLYYSTGSHLERESMQMMESIAMNPMPPGPPGKPHGDVRLPYFSVMIDHAGETTEISGGFFDLSDREYLRELLQAAFDKHANAGVLEDYNFRFSLRETPMGRCIVFADMSSEQSTLRNLIRTFLTIGSAAFLVFLGISILLAHWAVKPVDRAWQQQKQFVADASHELKTPLTVIQTSAELLHAPDCPGADREPLSGSILTMSSQMRGLVESLLDLARIDDGAAGSEFNNVPFSGIVSDAAMMFEPVFFEKELPFSSEITPGIVVRGNASHLMQLVNTLLDNAQKYAAPRGQTVIRLTRSTHKRCTLEVSDQGDPIPAEDLKNIFKRFYRADKARAMNHSYGLGLSIAQSIAEEHHGKIRCESGGGWNRFFVELPCRAARSAEETGSEDHFMPVPIVAFAAYSGVGKTTLIEQLIPRLKAYGLRLAVVKHAAHGVEADREGKDSRRFTHAGADVVTVSTQENIPWAEPSGQGFPSLPDGIRDVDLVLVEGYKDAKLPQIGISRAAAGKGFPSPDLRRYLAVVTDEEITAEIPRFALDDYDGVAAFIYREIVMNSDAGHPHFNGEGPAAPAGKTIV